MSEQRTGQAVEARGNFLTEGWRWVFGTKKAVSYAGAEDAYRKRPHKWVANAVFLLGLALVVFYMGTPSKLDLWSHLSDVSSQTSWRNIGNIFQQLVTPDWEYFFGGTEAIPFKYSVVYQIYQTFAIAFVATLMASLLALPFGLFASHKLFGGKSWISTIILICIRTFPELILALLVVAWSGPSLFSGLFALTLHSIGMIGKLDSEQIDSLNMEPLEALKAAGGTKWQQISLGVIPNSRASLLSVALYRLDINVRTATILSIVIGPGKCGIGYSLLDNVAKWHREGACILGIVILIIAVDFVSSAVRKKLI